MAYKVLYTRSAVRDIRKLDSVAKKKIGKKIEKFSKKPLFNARKLLDPKIGNYRWRAGNYRIVFDIEKSNIIILRVGHRKEVYKWK